MRCFTNKDELREDERKSFSRCILSPLGYNFTATTAAVDAFADLGVICFTCIWSESVSMLLFFHTAFNPLAVGAQFPTKRDKTRIEQHT